jgi:DNA-binding NarL/FixJ family response regulator
MCFWSMTATTKARKAAAVAPSRKQINILLLNGLADSEARKVGPLAQHLANNFTSLTSETIDIDGMEQPPKRGHHNLVLLVLNSWSPQVGEKMSAIRARQRSAKVICLFNEGVDTKVSTLQSFEVNGAVGLDHGYSIVKNAIRTVMEGHPYYPRILWHPFAGPHELERPYKNVYKDALTKQELVVLRYIALEYTNEQIAELMRVGKRTVDTHRESLLKKIGALNTAGLVKAAIVFEVIKAEE